MLVLSIPSVQTKIAEIATDKINEKLHTNIVIKKVDLSLLGSIRLKEIEIRDHHKDTLIFVKELSTSLLNAKRITDNKLKFSDITLNGLDFHIKTYKGEKDHSFTVFLDQVDKEDPNDTIPSKNPFKLETKNIYINNLNFKLIDENSTDKIQFSALKAGGNLQDFLINGSKVSMKIRGMYFVEDRNINVSNLSTDFSYTNKQMLFKNTSLKTANNTKVMANIEMNYRIEDLSSFNDKVKIKATFDKSELSIVDVNKLYDEIKGSDHFYFSGKLNGVLNNFSVSNLNLYSKKGLRIIGDLGFVNAVTTERGFLFDGDLRRVTSNYHQLKEVLPNILGRNLPTEFKKLGKFTLSGLIKVTPQQMDATVDVKSEIGGTISDLQLSNIDDIDRAEYSGVVEFVDFDFGKFLEDENFGKVSLKADVDGGGFNPENVNTTIIGKISSLHFRGYDYKDINVNGQFENKKFDGLLISDDENFRLKFEGLADFSSEQNKFDFVANIDKVDLKKTKLFTRDSIALLSGNVLLDVSGNTVDDIVGKVKFKNLVYQNQNSKYPFKEFEVTSSIKDSIKTIKVNSSDIAEGKIKGKFSFKDLIPMAQNSLGSIYTNYTPEIIAPNQYMDFDFSIYNQIVDIFFPEITIDKKTTISGKIRSNDNYLKVNFSSPKIRAYKSEIEKVVLRLDNKNELYNTHLTVNKIKNNYYNVSNLNLINRTLKDTLYFRTVFKGGKKKSEDYNLDFYYTINKDKKSVVGIQKSSINFKGNDWFINPKNNKNNNIVFSFNGNDFKFNNLKIVSDNQKIDFKGVIKKDEKDLALSFKDVNLTKILPEIDSLAIGGLLNGKINFNETIGDILPKGNLTIKDFKVNNVRQGNVQASVFGENSYEKYKVDIALEDKNIESFTAKGVLDFTGKEALTDLIIRFNEYDIAALSPLGGDVLSNLRGKVSGGFTAKGALSNPNFDGGLQLKNAGLSFPYLNVDYNLINQSFVKLKAQAFIFENITLQDTVHKTEGKLVGKINHIDFEKWFLDLAINSDNILVLNTEEKEESLYYGTGFLNAQAQIKGVTNNLRIDVNGRTNKGTRFVIPLSDVTTVNNYSLIHFKGEKTNEKPVIEEERIEGLNLNMNLNVTKDAVAQVVIDKSSGSDLEGRGQGNLQIDINTRGKFLMYGDYVVDKGVYNFKYGGVISKPFKVLKGGTISWTGSPSNAELDLVAVYETKANPGTLLENYTSGRKIPVELYTEITGGLFSSKQNFDIKIPNANTNIASELDFILNDNDKNTKMRQFFSLLISGSFFSEDNIAENASTFSANTASDLVANILSEVINTKDGKFQVGLGYTQGNTSEIDNLRSDNQVDVSLTTRLSNRVIVNGKVGVPVGANTQTNVVGEVKLEVLLNESGSLRGTVFNRQNEVQFSNNEEGYTQGVGLSYQVNFNNLPNLLKKLGLKKKEQKKKQVKKDSTKNKLINFKK